MKIEQKKWANQKGWSPELKNDLPGAVQLVLIFGDTGLLKKEELLPQMRQVYPKAYFLGCSTAGEIYKTEVSDNTITLTAVHFDSTELQGASVNIGECENSFEAGERLALELNKKEKLAHVLVLSDGIKVNGSELVSGLTKHLPKEVAVTGGLAGDGARFVETLVICDAPAQSNRIAALGFYGERLKVGYGSLGGWDPFGPNRRITQSKGNVLYKLDGQPALTLYKKYLGEHAAGLPSTGLLFPLNVKTKESDRGTVRTILAVNEGEQSMTFAGDMPEGAFAQLMKANFDRLVDGAQEAARTSAQATGSATPDLAILISCVGRKLVLKQRIEEEVEAVQTMLGKETALTGFYSYGEICPAAPNADCELHNQTMTITTLSER